jgi:hypothetical protein
MRVHNKTDHGVFVSNYGVIPAGEDATVRESESVKQMIRDDVLDEVTSSAASTNTKSEEASDDDA